MGSPTTARARLYDQRYSNSIWLGKLTGYAECVAGGAVTSCTLKHTAIDGTQSNQHALAENGDVWQVSNTWFGVGGTSDNNAANDATEAVDPGAGGGEVIHHKNAGVTVTIDHGTNAQVATNKAHFAYLKEGKTSVQTSDYFAVGSTIEVLGTTWDDEAVDADVDLEVGIADTADSVLNPSSNKYRKFKVTGHVTNEFNREFAKLDSFPADDGITPSTLNEDKPDYHLKITSNNGTVHSYSNINAAITTNEVQVIILGTGQDSQNTNQIWKLTYKGEESNNMDFLSTPAEVAEEINSFSALSGAVKVQGEGTSSGASGNPRYAITFHETDGDVAQLGLASVSNTVAVVTRANGWSIEGPVSLNLDSIQSGGMVNITAREQCKFTIAGTDNGVYYLCYDGICSSDTFDQSTFATSKVTAIKDNNGDSVLSGATGAGGQGSAADKPVVPYYVNMPIGKSCDGLEMRMVSGNTVTGITKTVSKRNNGKTFKITRSFLHRRTSAMVHDSATYDADLVSCADGDCYDVLGNVDSLLVSSITGATCNVVDPANVVYNELSFPVSRIITSVAYGGNAAATALTHEALVAAAAGFANTVCQYSVARSVISLDSMPTSSTVGSGCASDDGTAKAAHGDEATCIAATDCGADTDEACIWTPRELTLSYSSPVGSCSVAETTKGTYESYECSNRGACDGKSGLCTCYEGYSGQSCQTQTVLVQICKKGI